MHNIFTCTVRVVGSFQKMNVKRCLIKYNCSKKFCAFITLLIGFIWYYNKTPQEPPRGDYIAKTKEVELSPFPLNYNVHIFYFGWYRNEEFDGKYRNWHLRKPTSGNTIASNYYPLLGLYSSNDPNTIDYHMQLISDASIGVVIVGWVPNFFESTPNLKLIFKYAHKYHLKVSFHLLDYENRTIQTIRSDLKFLFKNYGEHPALYKTTTKNGYLPMVYIYDSYLISVSDWRWLLLEGNYGSVRGTKIDAIYIGLLTRLTHQDDLKHSGFDGAYTYFAKNGFTFGSTWKYWRDTQEWFASKSLLFIPTVGPGYDDTMVRPWNSENRADRLVGKYYITAWHRIIQCRTNYTSISSFNEWHEGTQIEPAVPHKNPANDFKSSDYGEGGPHMYLELTRNWIKIFTDTLKRRALD